MITEQRLYMDFEKLKTDAQKSIETEKYGMAIDCMRTACALAKNFYLCYEDDDLERMTQELSSKIINAKQTYTFSNRFLFYDTHTTDNIALTQQYLGALLSLRIPFMYMTTKSLKNDSTSLIRTQIEASVDATVCEIPNILGDEEKAQYIYDKVIEYAPSKALIQTTSDDVVGVIAWEALKHIQRFYIDLSDHSFWLGAKVFDYFITFRSCGFNICTNRRKIQKNQIFIQPFYPTNTSKPFMGLPAESEQRVKLLSGGRLEKIYGKNDAYFRLVKRILDENKNVSFYFAGGGAFGKLGQTSYLHKMIKKYNLGDRFYILGFRNDIIELFRHVDIYIGTYPIGGGLMTQIAASNQLPVVQFASPGLSDCLAEFLMAEDGNHGELIYQNEDTFALRVKELVENENKRKEFGKILSDRVLTKPVFDENVKDIIYKLESRYTANCYEYDCENLRKNQIETENLSSHSHARIMIKSKYLMKQHPLLYFQYVFQFFLHSDKKWLLKKILGR